MSFGLSKTPAYRIRAMTAHPTFPVQQDDPDEYFQYAAHMQGRLGLKSAIEPRRARSASPRRSRASIELEMEKIATQKPKPPAERIPSSRRRKPRIAHSYRRCHSAHRPDDQRPVAHRRPKSAMPPSLRTESASPGAEINLPNMAPPRPRSAFVREKELSEKRPKSAAFVRRKELSEKRKSSEVVGDRERKASLLKGDVVDDGGIGCRRISSDTLETKTPRISGMWSKSIELLRKKSSTGNLLQRKPSAGGKFFELVLRMKGGNFRKRSSIYLRTAGGLPEPIERFQRVAHTVKLLMGFCIHLKKCASSNTKEEWSFMEYHLNLEAELNQLMAFRMEQYTNRNTRKDRGSEKLKQLLGLDPEKRTDRDIYIISALIKSNEAFQEYPHWMQQKLCRKFHYRSFEARRVLYKEGHVPHFFYILMTGTVMMNVKEYDKKKEKTFSHTISQVFEGQSFGEQALLRGSTRVTTAICKTAVELLVLYQTDFDEIIKIPLQNQRQNHVQFIKSLELFHDYPRELLEDKSNMRDFFYQYFKKGAVIVKNNRRHKFLIIVKSGRCNIVVEYKNAMQKILDEMPKPTQTDQKLFPLICDRIRQTLINRASRITLDLQRDHMRGLMMKSLMPDMAGPGRQLALEKERKKKKKTKLVEKKEELLTPFSIGAAVARMGAGVSASRRKEEEASMARESVQTGKKRATDPKDENEDESAKWSGMNFSDLPGEYARVAMLQAGDVFGLETLFESTGPGEEDLPLILASEGAECLVISKKLFLDGANHRVLQVVSDMVVGWPSVEYVGQKIKDQKDWQTYKQIVVNDVVQHSRRKSRTMSAHI